MLAIDWTKVKDSALTFVKANALPLAIGFVAGALVL